MFSHNQKKMRKNAFSCCKYPNAGFRVSPSTAIKPKKNGKNTMNKLMTAVWDDNACVTSGAYVVEATGWWSEDGKGWYGVESSADLKNSTILFVGGHLDGSYNK